MGIKKTAKKSSPATKAKSSKKSNSKTAKSSASKKQKSSKSNLNLYSNLAYKRRVSADVRARKKAEELAKLPKNPVARFFARLRPDRVFKWIFSRDGLFFFLKFCAACFLIGIIVVGGLFLYFKKDLKEIEASKLANNVTSTVNTYYDRNGELLWEDKGSSDYRITVDGDEISTYMRQATVSIEDRNFYNHIGIDPKGLLRAALVTLTGGSVQGGSTLTQQLIKQVYFSEEAKDRSMHGIPRKIKEMILAIEVEKMYSKEEIITLYLNESPYGGRRNGVESAARTYFGKPAKDLNLAESALLAAIPNNPAVLNPYNTAGNEKLIKRQHKVLNDMCEMGYISEEQAKEAAEIDILAQILPESSMYQDIKAPWFVLEVKNQLEAKYGIKTMRSGGFKITTTLDYRAQQIAEEAVAAGANKFYKNQSDNAGLVSVDVETGQVIAMVGSADWNIEGYGQVNTTTSLLEPASTIKPILDYAPLFMEKPDRNYSPGTVWPDVNIDSIYCKGTSGKCSLRNASRRFYGNITIRQSLAGSLNIGAVKALYVNGIDKSLEVAHKLGDVSYCAFGENAGLSMGIGGGCSVRPVEHANAYASLARGGVYKDLAYYLKVENNNGDVVDSWSDSAGERVLDPQTAYMVTDILADADTRRWIFGGLAKTPGFYSPNTWFAAKTGTTENGAGRAKDSWIMTYSPVLATAIWNGNHDGRTLANSSHDVALAISAAYMDRVHSEVYGADGKWHPGMKIEQPAGIQRKTINGKNDIVPSWFNKKGNDSSTEKMIFDSITKKKATDCTPPETRVEIEITKIYDPVLDKTQYQAGEYDTESEDNLHQCNDTRPNAKVSFTKNSGSLTPEGDDEEEGSSAGDSYKVVAKATQGTHALSTYEIVINGSPYRQGTLNSSGDTIEFDYTGKINSISFTIRDQAGYSATSSK